MAGTGAVAAGGIIGPVLLDPVTGARAGVRTAAGGPVPTGLFTLGVASGDPLPEGVVLWTRLAPKPTEGGGMPPQDVTVRWEVAKDRLFQRGVQVGDTVARPDLGHSVHVEVNGLLPDREYFYRFRVGQEISPVGRTRTAPRAHSVPRRLRFAFASCQSWQDGYYTPYEHMLQEDLAFVAFLGDYIYESRPSSRGVRSHEGTDEPYTLDQYRNRHGQYRTDKHLQAVHAAHPWIVTLDDHEIDNNWGDEIPQDPAVQTPEGFRARRTAAFQAYYEHMPLRRESLPNGLDMQVYRRLDFGRLVSFHVLDTRQYRTDQPADEQRANLASATITGAEQERWLTRGLTRSGARWNILANQVMIAQSDGALGAARNFGDWDQWDGYRVQRARLMRLFGSGRVRNPVVVTGDRHATWVCDLKLDFDDPASATVGAEFVGTSISSGGDSDQTAFHSRWDPLQAENPHWKYWDGRRGYFVCDVQSDQMTSRLRVVDSVRRQSGTTIKTAAEFRVESGKPGVQVVTHDTPPTSKHLLIRPPAPDNDQPL
ncbi:alkaline phosphatase [Actinomadura rudentiformis]|uniref:Alkaline phosphatase n=1 Tax=Actinomadura rudentiformis TaxID=359158 RepID=A0A6H9YTB7_9ACTN|nr:alkaline phosphatase [Actinomadura rudentiformis]